MTTIGKRILQKRTELGMSQDELAVKVGYKDRSSIAKIESGDRDIRQRKVVAFANALKTTPQWLMGYDEHETKEKATGTNADRQKTVFISYKSSDANAFTELLSQLSDAELKQVYDYARFLVAQTKSEKGK